MLVQLEELRKQAGVERCDTQNRTQLRVSHLDGLAHNCLGPSFCIDLCIVKTATSMQHMSSAAQSKHNKPTVAGP